MKTEFKRVQEEIEELKWLLKDDSLTEKGKEKLKELKTLMDYVHSSLTLPTERKIFLTCDDSDGEVLAAFTDANRAGKEAAESGCGFQECTLYE